MNTSNKGCIDVSGRKMCYQPWPVDMYFNYRSPLPEEINETYGISGQAVKETYLAFKNETSNTYLLIDYLNNHMPFSDFYVDESILLDNSRWYTNEFYFYFIMFTKKVLNNYDWHYSEGENVQLSRHHKIYEIGHLQYSPFGKDEKDVTNSVIFSIMLYVKKQNIDTTYIYKWLDALAGHKSNLIYSKDISGLENYWICSEFIFFFYEFVKIVTNVNNFLTICYESIPTYSLRFFSYGPEKVIIEALKMIINKSGKIFRVDIKQNHKANFEITVTRKKHFDINKMHNYIKSINTDVNKIVPGVYLRMIENFFSMKRKPVLRFLTPVDDFKCSFSISWEIERDFSFLISISALIILGISAFFIPFPGFTWIKYCILSFLAPSIVLTGFLYKYKKELKTRQKLEKQLTQVNQENVNRLDKLETISEELIQEKIELEHKVAARTKELKETNDKLKELDKIKTNFFNNISHELKTPLTLILSPLESIINKQYGGTLSYDNHIFVMMRNNCNRLLQLIIMLLRYSKIEQSKMKLNKILIDIIKFTKTQFMLFEHKFREKKINHRFICNSSQDILLKIDKSLFEMVIANLISNAVKFSPEKSEISLEIKISKKQDEVFIIVKDTGIGIPEEKQKRIFERFYQVESNINRKHEGTGLGLSFTKEIIDLHGGRISVKSRINKGSIFTIALPAGYNNGFKKSCNAKSNIQGNLSDIITDNINTKNKLTDSFQNLNDRKKKKKILLVDDNKDMNNYIKFHLQSSYHVITAVNGREALDKIKADFIPDLVISDIMMPVMDGYTFIQEFSKLNQTSLTPFIFLTARESMEERLKGFKYGAINYITKPFNMRILISHVDNLIGHNAKRDEAIIKNTKYHLDSALNSLFSNLSGFDDEEDIEIQPDFIDKFHITKREKEIIYYVLKGLQDKEIAPLLNIATTTASKHLANIYEKVGVDNRLELTTMILKKCK